MMQAVTEKGGKKSPKRLNSRKRATKLTVVVIIKVRITKKINRQVKSVRQGAKLLLNNFTSQMKTITSSTVVTGKV